MDGPGEAVRSGRPCVGEAVDRPDHANRATLTHPVRPEPACKERQEHAASAPSTATRPLKGGEMEPFTGHDAIDHDESPVRNWRVSQLKRLGHPGADGRGVRRLHRLAANRPTGTARLPRV